MIERLLYLESNYFTAGAIFIKEDNSWKCVKTAPIIKWMIGKNPSEIKQYITKKNWKYKWL